MLSLGDIQDVDILSARDSYEKFCGKDFREHQYETIKKILESDKRVIVMKAGTGFGKSLVAAIVGHFYKNCLYLTGTKALQEQIESDFPEFHLLEGRNNYLCLNDPDLTRATCPFIEPGRCALYKSCPYTVAKRISVASPKVILNYAYYLIESNYVGEFGKFDLIVADEADKLEHELSNFISFEISEKELLKFNMGLIVGEINRAGNNITKWKEIAEDLIEALGSYKETIMYGIDNVNMLESSEGFEFGKAKLLSVKRMEVEDVDNKITKLRMFQNYVDKSWIINSKEDSRGENKKWSFSPVWLTGGLTEKFFLQHANKFLLMSATFHSKEILAKELGINEDEIEYIEVPSVFPPENRPIHIMPVADMRRDRMETEFYKNMAPRITEILLNYPEVKGIIHCFSYKVCDMVMSMNNPRFITHNSGNKEAVLKYFKMSAQPLILVSPSMDRGVSFEEDLARVIIVAKTPFSNLGDKKISARKDTPVIGQKWYSATACSTLEQMVGRGVRSKIDTCDVYLLDRWSQILYNNNKGFFSSHFHDCVVKNSTWVKKGSLVTSIEV